MHTLPQHQPLQNKKYRNRATTSDVVKDNIFRKARNTNEERKVIEELKEKSGYYIKADKRKTLVIWDKEDYDNRMKEKLENGRSRRLRTDPLLQLVKQVNKVVKE